jgi:hypothetical protein
MDGACGKNPGDSVPTSEERVYEAEARKVPEFTVAKLGGGQLRWSDNAGRPVVVVAGDAPQVAGGVRRPAPLTSNGTSPAVTGLVWDCTSPQGSPPPVEEFEKEAGGLPLPVGYAFDYPLALGYHSDLAAFMGQKGVSRTA